jgi:hypothetical protein
MIHLLAKRRETYFRGFASGGDYGLSGCNPPSGLRYPPSRVDYIVPIRKVVLGSITSTISDLLCKKISAFGFALLLIAVRFNAVYQPKNRITLHLKFPISELIPVKLTKKKIRRHHFSKRHFRINGRNPPQVIHSLASSIPCWAGADIIKRLCHMSF